MYSTIIFSFVVCCVLATEAQLTVPEGLVSDTYEAPTERSGSNGQNGGVRYMFGGTPAEEGAYPYLAALTRGSWIKMLLCGASIVTKRSIVTAAHCIHAVYANGALSNTLRATVGTNNWDEGGVMYSFSHNATHPNYIPPIKKNDIGVLFTFKEIVFTTLIKPIALDYDYVGKDVAVKIAGWGKTEEGTNSMRLMELTVDTIGGQECVEDVAVAEKRLNMSAFPLEPHIELCTYHSRSHGTCKGDSGGPLVRVDNSELVGIVSWGFPCAKSAPDVYARISAFKDWLENVIV